MAFPALSLKGLGLQHLRSTRIDSRPSPDLRFVCKYRFLPEDNRGQTPPPSANPNLPRIRGVWIFECFLSSSSFPTKWLHISLCSSHPALERRPITTEPERKPLSRSDPEQPPWGPLGALDSDRICNYLHFSSCMSYQKESWRIRDPNPGLWPGSSTRSPSTHQVLTVQLPPPVLRKMQNISQAQPLAIICDALNSTRRQKKKQITGRGKAPSEQHLAPAWANPQSGAAL